jgi:8-oxo-dGTP diphosphatase
LVFTLVRHAHAGDKRQWTLLDQLRPLSVHGWQQAAGLVEMLTGRTAPVLTAARLLSSPYLRCHQTLLPLAAGLRATVEDCDLLAPHADPADLDEFLAGPGLEGAVLCTHGETLTALLERWHSRGAVNLPFAQGAVLPTGLTEKGGSWIVDDVAGGRSAHYLPPPAPANSVLVFSGATRTDSQIGN